MLKKLRLRFVGINMAIVLVILCTIFGVLLHTTRANLERESVDMITAVAADPLQLNWPDTASRLPYFTVRISPYGSVRVSGTSYYDLSDEQVLSGIVTAALRSGSEQGLLHDYSLRYLRTTWRGSEYIVFADVSSANATMQNLWRSCILIGLCAAAVFLAVSFLLARWAVKPVERAWTQQKQFVSDASHELKTPLTVILTNAEMLRDPSYSEPERQRFAESILTMSHQMRGLVENLLELARVDNGAVKKVFEALDWSSLVQDAVLPFEALFFEKGLTLQTDIEPGITVRGSAQHLRQCAEILLDNAVKYSAPGTVRVALKKTGHDKCALSVATPGEPLSPEECKNVFKRFYRADRARAMEAREEAAVLAKNEQLRANLLRSISHDLRTPLTSISGNADVLLDQGSTGTAVLDAQTRRGLLLSIRSDALWLNATVENLLAITKLEGGGMRLPTTLELMDDIVEEALRHVNPAVREHDLKVVACDEPALVNVDARLMVQLVVNLVNNAITYTPAGSHIVISIGVDDGRVACSVADDGPGIAPEDRERIFESFYTANHGLADSHRSVGLGLSLCRSIALAHGGSIEVAAADPHGSVFTIELPVADVSFDKE